MASRVTLGVISDTHGRLRPEALAALAGVDRILHAGDLGGPGIVPGLETIAPVEAICGNVDRGDWAASLPATRVVEAGGLLLYLLHDLSELDLDPTAAGFAAVISGHSHRPTLTRRHGVLYLNPGSAGPRRFDLPVSVARLVIHNREVEAQLITLES